METATKNSLRQLISSTLPPYNPYVWLERKAEVEDKVLSLEVKENAFIDKGLCSLCNYKDNLRGLTNEQTHLLRKLIQDEECVSFCESCFKVVIQMIKLSKEIKTLNARLAQSLTCIKSVLRIKHTFPKLLANESEVEAISINESSNDEIQVKDEPSNKEISHPPFENIEIEFDVKVEDEEDVEMIPVEEEENIEKTLWNGKQKKKEGKNNIYSKKKSKVMENPQLYIEPDEQQTSDLEEAFHPPIEIEFDIKEEDDQDVEIKPEINEEDLEISSENGKFYCSSCKQQYADNDTFERHKKTRSHLNNQKQSGKEVAESVTQNNSATITNEPTIITNEKKYSRGKRKSRVKAEQLIKANSSEQKVENEKSEDEYRGSEEDSTSDQEEYSQSNKKRMRKNQNQEKSKKTNPDENEAFKCPCGLSFLTKLKLQKHHKTVRCLLCDICKRSIYKNGHKQHLKSRQHLYNLKCPEDKRICFPRTYSQLFCPSKINTDRFHCPCGKSYTTKTDLKRHRDKVHYGLFHVHCVLCDKKYSKKDYPTHLVSKEHLSKLPEDRKGEAPVKTKFLCEICPRTFQTQVYLDYHIKSKHLLEKYYRCGQCYRPLATKELLKKHEEKHINGKVICESCGKTFASILLLRLHVKRLHMKRIPQKCPKCGDLFASKFSLNGHLKAKHKTLEERCFCPECNENFASLILKKEHDKTVHNKGFFRQCSQCPKSFSIKSRYNVHLKMHNGEKPFPCGKCGKSLSSQATLDRHYKAVCGGVDEEEREKVRKRWRETCKRYRAAKNYKCDKCGEAFAEKPALLRHKKKEHKDD